MSEFRIQDPFLNTLRKEKIGVTIHLLDHTTLTGTIQSFDSYSILLHNAKPQLVYKHAIINIVPDQNFKLNTD